MRRGAVIEAAGNRIDLLDVRREGTLHATGQTADAPTIADGYWFYLRMSDEGEWRILRKRPRYINGAEPRFTEAYEL